LLLSRGILVISDGSVLMTLGNIKPMRLLVLSLGLLLLADIGSCHTSTASEVRLFDLQGRAVEPLAQSNAKATVLIFTRSDCPISNRYAPVIQGLYRRFSPQGVAFWMVYVDPGQPVDQIRAHLKEYGYRLPVVLDPTHKLVKIAGAHVTPEAVVFSSHGKLLYHGRIDNLYAGFGESLPAATRKDLELTLVAILAGQALPEASATPVGCYISDLE
jgi:AhpC/TSA family